MGRVPSRHARQNVAPGEPMQSYVDDGECRVYESHLEEGKAIEYDCLAHDTSVRFTCLHPEKFKTCGSSGTLTIGTCLLNLRIWFHSVLGFIRFISTVSPVFAHHYLVGRVPL